MSSRCVYVCVCLYVFVCMCVCVSVWSYAWVYAGHLQEINGPLHYKQGWFINIKSSSISFRHPFLFI